MNEKMTKEQAIEYVLAAEKELNSLVATQYLGMPRGELKNIMLTVVHKTEELQILCHEYGLDFHKLTGR